MSNLKTNTDAALNRPRFLCQCVVQNREDNESQRDWLKRWMCMFHWMQTDYYREKLKDAADSTTYDEFLRASRTE